MIGRFALIAGFVLLAVAPPSNQCVDLNTLIANQSGNFTWVSSAPAGSNTLVDYAHYKTYVQNQTTTCTVPGLANNWVMTWGDVIACASVHTSSQQSETVAGNYHTVSYTATFNANTGLYVCHGPNGSTGYDNSPMVLPAGTVAPTASTPISLTLTNVSFPGTTTSLKVQLKDPNGSVVQTWPAITGSWSGNWTSGIAGAWSWVIIDTGGSIGACDSTNGVTSYGGTQSQWSAQAKWFQ